MMRKWRTKVLYGAGVLVALVVGGGVASVVMAAIPDTAGNINACYNNITRAVRLTDPAGNCGGGQTPISWQQSAGGKIYSKLAAVSLGQTPTPLINIPGFGTVTLTECSTAAANATFTNTSGHTINTTIQADAVAPGGTALIQQTGGGSAVPYTTLGDQHYMLSYDAGANAQAVVSLWIGLGTTTDEGTPIGCSARVQAVQSL